MTLVVCLLSLAVKLAGVAYMNHYHAWNLVAPDARGSYVPLAQSLVRGEGYVLRGREEDATPIAPIFPVYLSAIYRMAGLDTPVWVIGALNAVLRMLVTGLVMLLTARAFGRVPALLAGLLSALDPWEAFWSAFLLKESLAVALSAVAALCWYRMLTRRSLSWALVAGASVGVAGLTRFPTLGLAPWIVLGLVCAVYSKRLPWHRAAALAGSLLAGVLLVLSPWLVRNHRVFGEWLVSHRFVGTYLYVSNGPGATRVVETWGYSGLAVGDAKGADAALANASLGDQDRLLLRAALNHLVDHPGDLVKAAGARFVNMWRPTFAGSSWRNRIVLGWTYLLMMGLSLVGIAVAARSRADDATWPARMVLLGMVSYVLVLHVFFWSEIRYRQYATPFLLAFAGVGLGSFMSRVQTRRYGGHPAGTGQSTIAAASAREVAREPNARIGVNASLACAG